MNPRRRSGLAQSIRDRRRYRSLDHFHFLLAAAQMTHVARIPKTSTECALAGGAGRSTLGIVSRAWRQHLGPSHAKPRHVPSEMYAEEVGRPGLAGAGRGRVIIHYDRRVGRGGGGRSQDGGGQPPPLAWSGSRAASARICVLVNSAVWSPADCQGPDCVTDSATDRVTP